MIESNIIKRLIVKTFMQNSRRRLEEIAEIVMRILNTKFFVNETVIIKESGKIGKVLRCNGDSYLISSDDGEIEISQSSISRKSSATYDDILDILEAATTQTAFGRILIENIFEKISKPEFGVTAKSELRKAKIEARNKVAYTNYRGPYVEEIAGGRPVPRGVRGSRGEQMQSRINVESYMGAAQEPLKHGDMQREHNMNIEPIREINSREVNRIKKPKFEKLDISKLQPFIIENFSGDLLDKLIKIYIFLRSFKNELFPFDFTIEELASSLNDSEYASEIIFRIHSGLIMAIESEMKVRKEKFIESVSFILDRLEEFETDMPVQSIKKRNIMTIDNWKLQTKIFIQNFSKESDDDRVLQFMGFYKKLSEKSVEKLGDKSVEKSEIPEISETSKLPEISKTSGKSDNKLSVRLNFIIFLIDLLCISEKFRVFIDNNHSKLRDIRSKHEELSGSIRKCNLDQQAEIAAVSSKMSECDIDMATNPLRIHLGKYTDYIIFIMDKNIMLRNGSDYYILTKENIRSIILDLDRPTKTEKHLIYNLKFTSEILLK